MKSWKTTLGGVGTILAGIGIIINMVTSGNYPPDQITAAMAAISGGFGLIFARDNGVSSEEAGAK